MNDKGRQVSLSQYVAYGLGIRSALPLPEVVRSEVAADVEVRLDAVDEAPTMVTPSGHRRHATEGRIGLFEEGVGTFLIVDGREIVVDPAPAVDERVLRLFILGPALAVLLHQRGWLVLHGSAVAIQGRAVACLGAPGWGKSTLAAALHRRGHAVVADDVTVVRLDQGSVAVVPGFPQLKLWPDAARRLGAAVESLPRLHPRLDKRGLSVSEGFPIQALPLGRVYVLCRDNWLGIEPLRATEALQELVRHSYCAQLLPFTGLASHFHQCASLVTRLGVSRLHFPSSLDGLADLAETVERDVGWHT